MEKGLLTFLLCDLSNYVMGMSGSLVSYFLRDRSSMTNAVMATNSLIIANLPDWSVNSLEETESSGDTDALPSTFLESLRAIIEVHREVVHWVPVRK